VAGNRLVGISVDGSPANAVRDNVVSGGRDGIRVFGASTGVLVAGNAVRGPADAGVLVDAPARGTDVTGNTIAGARNGVRLRGTAGTNVLANRIVGARAHAVLVTGEPGSPVAAMRVASNELQGSGASPIAVGGPGADAVRSADNRERWDFPAIHDAATVLRRVGVGAWALLFVLAALAPGATVRMRRRPHRSDGLR
jgi:parallel beta-helix repeat protein